MKPFLIDKPLGATPLQAMTVFRQVRGMPDTMKLAYAGRLDPMATGLLPLLHGEQLQRQEEYWYLPKRYQASVLLGIQTDSYDLLGIPVINVEPMPDTERITATIRGMVGKIDLSVPLYSSHRVEGKPLFSWTKNSHEGPPVVPVRRMTVSQIDITGTSEIHSAVLLDMVLGRVGLVQGDFRQDRTCSTWLEQLHNERYFTLVHLDIQCGSGTYIRSIAHEIGRRLGIGAVVADLRRIRVGSWNITDGDVTRLSWPG